MLTCPYLMRDTRCVLQFFQCAGVDSGGSVFSRIYAPKQENASFDTQLPCDEKSGADVIVTWVFGGGGGGGAGGNLTEEEILKYRFTHDVSSELY